MDALSHGSRPFAHARQSHQLPCITLPHPFAILAVFATYFATFATSCRLNRPPPPMNPRIALIQNQKAAKTAMPLSCHTSPSTPRIPPCSSVSSVVVLVSVRHGRLTCDPPDAYSTGAIWDRLPNLSPAPPRERPPAPVMTTAADHPDSTIEEPPWLFAPS